jgi:hypothetical protein
MAGQKMCEDESPPWRWLASTRELQETAFGVDFSQRKTSAQLADNMVHQGFALFIELAEAFGELQWKDWAQNRGELKRDAMVGELVDTAHFLANLLVHLDVTDDEWERLYREKQERNRTRQRSGYDSTATKCPRCKRELDKPGAVTTCPEEENDHGIPLACGECWEWLGMLRWDDLIEWRNGVSVPGITAATFYGPVPEMRE